MHLYNFKKNLFKKIINLKKNFNHNIVFFRKTNPKFAASIDMHHLWLIQLNMQTVFCDFVM